MIPAKGNKVKIGIGQLITPEEQQQFASHKEFGAYLRKVVYVMPEPEIFISRKDIEKLRQESQAVSRASFKRLRSSFPDNYRDCFRISLLRV